MPRKITKELLLCVLSAFLLVLSFPGFNIEILAWFGFVPLFFALKDKSKTGAFLFSFLAGIIFWLGTIYWLIHVTLPGMLILVLYLALYFGVFGLIISGHSLQAPSFNILFIPSVWVVLEFIRGRLLTGFPWALLGYSQYLNLPLIQIADITGVWGVSFLVMMVNVFVYKVMSYKSASGSDKRELVLCFLIIFLCLGYGFYKLPLAAGRTPLAKIKISVIQGNIPQEMKWDPGAKDFIIDKYITLTGEALKDKPDLIIWPEAALPVVLNEEPYYFEKVRSFVKKTGLPLLFGAVTLEGRLYYNSALLVSGQGDLVDKYDKLHLVPFGEYIPLRGAFKFLETVVPIGDFKRGEGYTIFDLSSLYPELSAKFSVLICFEDLFPELSRRFVKRGADFLVNITNDAWFKKTSSPYQHLSASVFRAVENRVFLVRAANTGVSGFIAPTGRILYSAQDQLGNNIFISGYESREILPAEGKKTGFYTRYGDFFVAACFLFSLGATIIFIKRR